LSAPNLSFLKDKSSSHQLITSIEKKRKKPFIFQKMISEKKDIDKILEAAKKGADFLIVETGDWKIIPLETIIAEIHKTNTKIFAHTSVVSEIDTLCSVLERGVDGVILKTTNIEDVKKAMKYFSSVELIDLQFAKILEIKDVGVGERACIDTSSILQLGEGLMIGNKSNFFFLIHNESIGSQFTSPRPFRVNAGSINSYVLMPDGRTKYLSELESGDKVLTINRNGKSRISIVGRIKIERRPLTFIKGQIDNAIGSILVQNAETIRFIIKKRGIVSVTELKVGDEVQVKIASSSGRHFGTEIEEFVLEK